MRWQDLLHAKSHSVLLAMPSAPSQTGRAVERVVQGVPLVPGPEFLGGPEF